MKSVTKMVGSIGCLVIFNLAFAVSSTQGAEAKQTTITYYVVKVISSETQLKIVSKLELGTLKKELAAKYKEDLKDYTVAKKEALKNREVFKEKKPVKSRVVVVKSGLRDRAKANEALKKAEEIEKKKAEKKKSSVKYAVVSVGEEIKVVPSGEVKAMKSKLDLDFKAALKDYQEEKKEAIRNNEKFTKKPPVKVIFKVVSLRISTEAKALALKEKIESKKRKKA